MEYNQLGNSGLRVPVISLGTATFGGTNEFFKKWGTSDINEASRLIDICLERGVNFFDTANVYSLGASEEILETALKERRSKAIVSTKATFKMGTGINEYGSSRYHLLDSVEASLKRLRTDYVDILFMHGYDVTTPQEETLSTLDNLIRSGKVRYIGSSNFTAWQLMKSLSVAERNGWTKYVVNQGYYSLIGRDYEWELLPLMLDQKIGTMVWSPLGWGRLTGKIRRGQPLPDGRIKSGGDQGGPTVLETNLFKVLEVLDEISVETGKLVPQIAINWLLQRPSVCNVVVGARNEQQLIQNLDSVGWKLTEDQIARLDRVSSQEASYPHWVGER